MLKHIYLLYLFIFTICTILFTIFSVFVYVENSADAIVCAFFVYIYMCIHLHAIYRIMYLFTMYIMHVCA